MGRNKILLTQTQQNQLHQLSNTMSYQQMADITGLSYGVVYRYCQTHKLKGKPKFNNARLQFQSQLEKLRHIKHGIYYLANRTKHISYIGYSCWVFRRLKEHLTHLQYRRHKNTQMQADWDSGDKFEIGILLQGKCPHLESVLQRIPKQTYNCNAYAASYPFLHRARNLNRFHNYIHKTSTCWLWTGPVTNKDGYGEMTWASLPKKRHSAHAHRIQYYLTHGDIPAGMIVRHTCHNKLCVNPAHLTIGTDEDNAMDGADNQPTWGRPPKVIDEDVLSLYQAGIKQSDIAKKLGVQPSTIHYRLKKLGALQN